MVGRCGKGFDADDTFEDGGGLGIMCGCRDDSGTVDEVDSTGQGDVLPDLKESIRLAYTDAEKTHLCFSRYRSNSADFTTFKGVYYTAFSDVGVTHEANRYLFLVRMELGKLAK